MDILLGLIFWGGLLLLTLNWLARTGSSRHRTDASGRADTRAMPPSTGAPPWSDGPRAGKVEDQRLREDEALADGLVIGHFLTRDHYQDRIDRLEDHIEELAGDRDQWTPAAADGDELDYAEFDALGGFGVEPWADDLFDVDDED